jgi:hypothetical protein
LVAARRKTFVKSSKRETAVFFPAILLVFGAVALIAASGQEPVRTPALGLEHGLIEFDTPNFKIKLVKDSQTLAALEPKGAGGFDFTPADRLSARAANGYYHLGDLTFSVKTSGADQWQSFSTASARQPVTPLPAAFPILAAADLTPTLPMDCPVQVIRTWALENGEPVLSFELKNKTGQPLALGALSIPMVFNNLLTDRTLEQAHEICSFSDPYTGQDAGYLQVTRLSGLGPALVVVPEGKTPFEAYQLLPEPTRPNQTFEGTFAWVAHSRTFAETDWKNAAPWNPPTDETLLPNATRAFGVRFLLSDQIRHIERTLESNDRPVAIGFPGYVLPSDIEGKLFLKYPSPVKALTVEPPDALAISAGQTTRNGWQSYVLRARGWGRARLTVTYADGTRQSIHYYLTKPAQAAVADLGKFLFTKQWYENPSDPFRRSPSVMSYDRERDKFVEQDNRVWIAGLGDEGGSGSWLAAAMKEFAQPEPDEVAKFERFIDGVLWGGIQYREGGNKYGVRKSLFYYAPQELPGFAYDKSFNWTTWASWKKEASEGIGRGYNYPHVVAAYWSMYRIARNNEGLTKNHPWNWYLEQAFQTTKFMFGRGADGKRRVEYVELGLMEGDIFLQVLQDLKREGWTDKALEVERLMKERADLWKTEKYPFASEMAWDSTGQEEVYAWCKYFGYDTQARVSLNSILGYMPTLPHWGYNGNARRYWDFLYGGKLRRIERQLHHYGSGLNAIPVLADYREHPEDSYLLRVGYGGAGGALTNIDRDGFASVAFHSFPDTLRWDAYSGDYGPNFFGHAMNSATYVVKDPEFGWQAFGGNIAVRGERVGITPLDSMRRRVYLAPLGLWLTLDAGTFAGVEINRQTNAVRIGFAAATPETPNARLRIEQPARIDGIGLFEPSKPLKREREAYLIPLSRTVKWIGLNAK